MTELEEMIRSALARFHGNLYWREYYEKAPSEACRRTAIFFCDEFGCPE